MRPAGLYEATEAGILFVGSSVEGMSKHELRSEKPWSSDLRTGVRLSSAPPKQYNPNLVPIGHGFGFIVFIEEVEDW